MTTMRAPAKINLALVVGPVRDDGLHEVATILQRIELYDTVRLERHGELVVEGFAEDTLVRRALESLAAAARVEPAWKATIDKRIPVAAGLGGGSSDAATALLLANRLLAAPLPAERLHELARPLGADVPFFLEPGPQLGTGTGATLVPLELTQDYAVLLLLPRGVSKESTGAVYGRFSGAEGFEQRRGRVLEAMRGGGTADLASLPANDLASSPLAADLRRLGAFRADVTGAGPAVYGLFEDRGGAARAAAELAGSGTIWVVAPAWYV
jgi:4-diphosphocytidyl-2-C-methyl-D-erythritol kinase